jgi:hypothetical protein
MNVVMVGFYLMINVLISVPMDISKDIKNVFHVQKVVIYVLTLIPVLLVKREKN